MPATRRFHLHVYISALFVGLLLAFSAALITMQYFKTREMLLSAASETFEHVENQIRQAISDRYSDATLLADFYSRLGLINDPTLAPRELRVAIMAQFFQSLPHISAIYVGRDNGDFFLGRPFIPGSAIAEELGAPVTAKYLFWRIERTASGEVDSRYLFYDDTLRLLEDRPISGETYDPRGRPWFTDAIKTGDTIVTSPYRFFTTHEVGTTFARRGTDGHTVAAVDLTLASFSDLLHSLRPTKSSQLVIFDSQRRIVADAALAGAAADQAAVRPDLATIADANRPVLAELVGSDIRPSAQTLSMRSGKGEWDGFLAKLGGSGPPLYLAVAVPQAELLAGASKIRSQSLLMTVVSMVPAIGLALACSRLASRPLQALTREAAEIRELKFGRPMEIRSFVSEIDLLATSIATMKSTIQRFLALGAVLAGEHNFDQLLQRLLSETMSLASARGGILYLAEPSGILKCAISEFNGQPLDPTPPDLDPKLDSDHPVVRAIAGKGASYMLRSDTLSCYPALARFDQLAALAVPLRNRQGELVGAVTLLHGADAIEDAEEEEVLALVGALSGTAAAAIDSQRLILEQKRLLEAIIQLVAGAIDRKSPYTGGHCQRVPELTKMIARAAEEATEEPFRDFKLTEEEWEELHVAAWLHDCGKVTTPEYVIDKATKLETICDRIHEIRMRFEVVKREATVACWQEIADGAQREPRLAELKTHLDVLDEEFAFIATCNVGGEFMAPDKIERLHQIARRTWTRTLDDRIGISRDELLRKERSAAMPPPILEPLLADKPEHVFERQPRDRLEPDNPWGFKVDVPNHLYNRGELYNLSIGRGTLTAEDRFKINEHMIETIRMLSHLPLPRHLSRVVEIAGGHHEKMDGTGYPRRLRREDMSLPARMMAIADIFEALTAVDRPYKNAKTLSESLGIMASMRDDAHIDPDLFDLFLSARVYQTYAERYLEPSQIDAIDPECYRRRETAVAS